MTKIDPSLLIRKIIHFDMDAFYASIEIRDNPSLVGKAVIVGGSPESRAVVCTANYEARKYGVRSAMPCSKAKRLCPQAVFLPPNFAKYQAVSGQIRRIFSRYTDLIEPLSLDEAYLDVTSNTLGLYAIQIARKIQEEVLTELGISGSAGVAPNKLLAKIASDIRKPSGLTVILPAKVTEFMRRLPLRKIHGIGPATEQRLASFGFSTCQDIWPYSLEALSAQLGRNRALWLYHRSRGLDDRPVEPARRRKSMSQEATFAADLLDKAALISKLGSLSQELAEGLMLKQLKGRTITLKVKYADFEQITRSYSLPTFTAEEQTIFEVSTQLLDKTAAGERKIRLLGIGISNLRQKDHEKVLSLNSGNFNSMHVLPLG